MRRNMTRFSGTEERSEINLTPMLDVVFIMLIFFIVTASFIKQAGIDVARPEALTSEQRPTVSVLVAISEIGEIWIDKKKVEEIARLKMPDLNAKDLEGAIRIIEGTARSMGLEVR